MSGYNKKLDEKIWSETVKVEGGKLIVSVWSYDGGTPKIQISRMRENDKSEYKYSFAKLGRMTADEIEVILPLLETAMDECDNV